MALGNSDAWRVDAVARIWGAAWAISICLGIASQLRGYSAAEMAALRGDLRESASQRQPFEQSPMASPEPWQSPQERRTESPKSTSNSDRAAASSISKSPEAPSASHGGSGFGPRPSADGNPDDPIDTPASRRASAAKQRRPARKGDPAVPVPVEETIAQALNDLASGNHFERRDALRDLKRLTPNEQRGIVSKALVAALEEDDHSLNADIIDVLGVWGTAESVPILIDQLDERGWNLENALRALGKLKDPRGAKAVAKLLVTRNAQKAVAALRDMGPAAEDALLPYLSNSDPRMRGEMCALLEEIGTTKCLPELKKRFSDDVKEVRLAAKQAYAAVDARTKSPAAITKEPEQDPFNPDSKRPATKSPPGGSSSPKSAAPGILKPVPR